MKQITWNLTPLFRGDDDPVMSRNRDVVLKKSYEFIERWRDRSDYLSDPALLRKALDDYESWRRSCGPDGNEGYYFSLRTAQDQNDPKLKAKYNMAEEFAKKIENDMQFFSLRIAKIPAKRQEIFLSYKGLKKYRHYLRRLFQEAKYLLSEPEERIMNLKTSTSYSNWVRMTSSFLSKEERSVLTDKGKRETKSFSEIASLMNNRTKKVRDSAAMAFNDILVKNVEVAEAEINSVLAHKKTDDDIRKVPRPDLTRHINDDIDTEIVDSLIRAVTERFSISRDYYALKARLLGVRQLQYHERNVEYGVINRKYPYRESVLLVQKVFKGLDRRFYEIFRGFLDNGQFDVFPRKGKVSGAFCSHNLMTQPTYILLNHTDRLNDVLTLAHELGHGINNELIRERQNALNFGTPTSTAEVASTFMEDFVLQEILKQADDELRLSIMMMKLNDDVSTIFRQIACYTFEQEIHQEYRKRGYLSKDEIGSLFRKHMSAYMGDAVRQSPGSENWWVYWSHIRTFFYVYSYASGLLISKSLQNSVKASPGFIEKVKEFLSSGLSDSPKNIFMRAGLDIAETGFWNRGLDEVDSLLRETEELAVKLGNIR